MDADSRKSVPERVAISQDRQDLAEQVYFMDEENEKEVDALRQEHKDAMRRFIAGFEVHGHSWRTKDLEREEYEERLDARNYHMMAKMREAGI